MSSLSSNSLIVENSKKANMKPKSLKKKASSSRYDSGHASKAAMKRIQILGNLVAHCVKLNTLNNFQPLCTHVSDIRKKLETSYSCNSLSGACKYKGNGHIEVKATFSKMPRTHKLHMVCKMCFNASWNGIFDLQVTCLSTQHPISHFFVHIQKLCFEEGVTAVLFDHL